MADRLEFREKLGRILALAADQGDQMTLDGVEQFFEDDGLSEEQVDLVCDYLLSQKVAVTGYHKQPGIVREAADEPGELSDAEQSYLTEYLRDMEHMEQGSDEEARMAGYLRVVTKEALKMHRDGVFLGDLIQEGNISLMVALQEHGGSHGSEAQILEEVRAGIQAFLESQTETGRQARKIVNQVAELDEVIKCMSEDLGRKVTIDEVAVKLGMPEEQIVDILKLTGEDEVEDGS